MMLAIDSESRLWLCSEGCYEIIEAELWAFRWCHHSSNTAPCCIQRFICILLTTYLLRLCLVLCRVELLGLLCVVRYCPLALAELLGLMFGFGGFLLGRHAECGEKEWERWKGTLYVVMSMV